MPDHINKKIYTCLYLCWKLTSMNQSFNNYNNLHFFLLLINSLPFHKSVCAALNNFYFVLGSLQQEILMHMSSETKFRLVNCGIIRNILS